MAATTQALRDIANRLRIDSIESTTAAGSGHPTSCCSIAEILAVLFFDEMRYHVQDPRNPNNDRLILSKGHAAPILYSAWSEAGLFPRADLLKLRQLDCDLEGHPTPRLSFVDVATGSLGQGLGVGAGMAWAGKYLDKADYRIYVVIGDGESAEGSIWEAISFASHNKLDNLVAIFDINRLGQSEPTMYQHHVEIYQKRLDAFGWNAIVVDGHDVDAVKAALAQARTTKDKPTALIGKTLKGKGIPGIEDQENWHGKPLGDKTAAALQHIKSQLTGANGAKPASPSSKLKPVAQPTFSIPNLGHKLGEKVATRMAYGEALKAIGEQSDRVVSLDGDTKNSTYSDKFKAAFPNRFIECFIAEQNLVGVGIGVGTRGYVPFASTFACFLTRAFDQLRMGAISLANVKLAGSHCGVSIGEDGPSQMALEDIAMFRTIPDCRVYYPCDARSTAAAVALAASRHGVDFIRTSRPATPVIYSDDVDFEPGKAHVVRQSASDQVTVVGAGVTLFEALKAADELAKDGIHIRVIDPFTIKPLDHDTLWASAMATGGKVLTVEDHYAEGGLGEAVASALSGEPAIVVDKLAVREIPHSGKPEELLSRYGIDAAHITAKVREMIG